MSFSLSGCADGNTAACMLTTASDGTVKRIQSTSCGFSIASVSRYGSVTRFDGASAALQELSSSCPSAAEV